MEIKQCVPQGLGPLLYLDLPLNIQSANLVMFTNDINVLITGSDVGGFETKLIG